MKKYFKFTVESGNMKSMNSGSTPFTSFVSSFFSVVIFMAQAAVLFVLAFIFVLILLFRDRNVRAR